MLRFEHDDRRRIAVATALTVVALPSLWLMSRDTSSGAPNVASVGVPIEAPAEPARTDAPEPLDAMGDAGTSYLDGPAASVVQEPITLAVAGLPDPTSAELSATFNQNVAIGTCLLAPGSYGRRVTVVNRDNQRSYECRVVTTALIEPGTIVLRTDAYTSIADLADAPVPVTIDW
ncbi:MAG: hypothetical protein MUE78_06615 [Ilumatobacteraceae bacterium]|nr:hypothetical protein [Ilumatobacteraceae bacterium]